MREYLTDAIVLDREPSGERDLRVTLFTERFGKMTGKLKSGRSIVSKLSPHLEAGNLARVRVVEKRGVQIVDALSERKVRLSPTALHRLSQILSEGSREESLWELLIGDAFTWTKALSVLGWDPRHVRCEICEGRDHLLFHIPTQRFFCANCASKLPAKEVLYMNEVF